MSDALVLHRSFYSMALGREKNYCIYLPASYPHAEERHYSTVYLLPGLMDYERTWIDKGHVHEQMDALIGEGRIGEMIIVMPDKDGAALAEERHAAFAAYLGGDLIEHIDNEFRTIPSRGHRGVEGLSLGAAWAVRMALNWPELYCSVGSLSGGFGDETYRLVLENESRLRGLGMRFRVGVGLGESEHVPNNLRFVAFLQERGFYCEFDPMDGPHDWPLWAHQIRNSLQFHYYSFNS